MASEQTPLLQDPTYAVASEEVQPHHDVYNRFNAVEKRAIVAHVTFAGLIPLFVSGSFIPSVPQIARELDTTGTVINLAISASIFSSCVGSLLWASYSGHYGRRPVFVISSMVLCVGSLGVTLSRSVFQLMAFRVLQALGSSSGFSNSMGVIGDVYSIEERGTATGVFYAGVLVGPAIAPVIGGLVAELYSWRTMQGAQFVAAFFFFLLSFFVFPETIHPGTSGAQKAGGLSRFVWLNPFKSLLMIRSPVFLCVVLTGCTNLMSDFFLVVPVAYTVAKKYGITSEAAIGAILIPDGLGSMFGAPITGYLSDRIVARRRKLRSGVWVPEDRLRSIQFSALVVIPSSLLISAFTTTYVDGPIGLIINLVCLFINGFGVDSVFTTLSAYNVDILHDRSAESTASAMAYRGTFVSFALAGLLPSIEAFGLIATYSVTAAFSLFGYLLVMCLIRYGDRMRAYVDIGFTTDRNN